jgi:hypothetical protein
MIPPGEGGNVSQEELRRMREFVLGFEFRDLEQPEGHYQELVRRIVLAEETRLLRMAAKCAANPDDGRPPGEPEDMFDEAVWWIHCALQDVLILYLIWDAAREGWEAACSAIVHADTDIRERFHEFLELVRSEGKSVGW